MRHQAKEYVELTNSRTRDAAKLLYRITKPRMLVRFSSKLGRRADVNVIGARR